MTRGMGNREPSRDTVSPAMEPTATMYLANMQPCTANISMSGASASISLNGTIRVRITETWRGAGRRERLIFSSHICVTPHREGGIPRSTDLFAIWRECDVITDAY
ncbi:hypothetical protein EYF80_052473 [Liparis tanakae]|uniref:Uncharacterized protein n=1 Tax=Liparis tanakae TaxID=230148 RepID=A0A4Z2F993_9TELE|nr:hypothetical protein EYF80_052473 [Liparis tanakae]